MTTNHRRQDKRRDFENIILKGNIQTIGSCLFCACAVCSSTCTLLMLLIYSNSVTAQYPSPSPIHHFLPKIVAKVVPSCPILALPGSMYVMYPRLPGVLNFSSKNLKKALLYSSLSSSLMLSRLSMRRLKAGSNVPPKVNVSL